MNKPPAPSPAPADPNYGEIRPPRHWRFWLIVMIFAVGGIYVLRSVLLPFVAGAAVAYFLDPFADWLERRGLSRIMATVVITTMFLVFFAGALLLLIPALHAQITDFVHRLPAYLHALEQRAEPIIHQAQGLLSPAQVAKLRDGVMSMVGDAASWGLKLIKGVLTSSLALVNILLLLVVTPVVAFYLLHDWDRMVETVDGWLPRHHAPTIRTLLHEINEMLAGFVRGQATVCLALGSFYAIGLSLVGLDLGLVVGLGAGMASVIPYVGTISGLLLSLGLAFAQFSDTLPVALVAGVFVVGQFLEGNVLSPLLVGERIGLHPVWLIFALLAGAELFGFVGILLAVPVAAVIGVLVRHFLSRYLASPLYHGGLPDAEHPALPASDDEAKD